MFKGKRDYLSPDAEVIALLSHRIICSSGEFNGIDTEIDENPDHWL